MRLGSFDAARVNALLDGLKETAESFVRRGSKGMIRREIIAFMRYVGQGWEIPVHLPDRPFTAEDAAGLKSAFESAYADFFGRAIDGLGGLEIEIVTFSVKAEDERPVPKSHQISAGTEASLDRTSRAVFDPAQGQALDTAIIAREALSPGDRIQGPAVIVERETSTVVTSPFDVVMQSDGSLLLIRKEGQA